MESGLSMMVLISTSITNGPIEQNQKCLEQTFVKGHMKSGSSNMVLILINNSPLRKSKLLKTDF